MDIVRSFVLGAVLFIVALILPIVGYVPLIVKTVYRDPPFVKSKRPEPWTVETICGAFIFKYDGREVRPYDFVYRYMFIDVHVPMERVWNKWQPIIHALGHDSNRIRKLRWIRCQMQRELNNFEQICCVGFLPDLVVKRVWECL